jgi:hypothetical protein
VLELAAVALLVQQEVLKNIFENFLKKILKTFWKTFKRLFWKRLKKNFLTKVFEKNFLKKLCENFFLETVDYLKYTHYVTNGYKLEPWDMESWSWWVVRSNPATV